MAAKKLYDVAVKTGSYEKNGETKNRYENIGTMFQGENGPYLVLKRTFNPAGVTPREGSDSIICSLFEPRDDNGGNGGGGNGGGYQRQGNGGGNGGGYGGGQQRQQPQGGQRQQSQGPDDDIPF